ncbi:hypothetical protein MX720_004599 [Vibrio parahaemolyticus]|nr:hypothetical protein [Vibrio parahaemolyticus]EKN4540078.1 hypothetical protein [Vibrio parahaemolyticus]HCG8975228.1 hypothetical protein [Vibrio parahaemolyticus]
MSQEQYKLINRSRLIDLPTLPAGEVFQWLMTKPEWMQRGILKLLANK